jgi:hypothetical protein
MMRARRVQTKIRCVPRFGYDFAQVREIDVDVENSHDDAELRSAVNLYFAARGISDALYDLDVDDDGYFAIVNDEAFHDDWGTPLL